MDRFFVAITRFRTHLERSRLHLYHLEGYGLAIAGDGEVLRGTLLHQLPSAAAVHRGRIDVAALTRGQYLATEFAYQVVVVIQLHGQLSGAFVSEHTIDVGRVAVGASGERDVARSLREGVL